MAYVDHLSSTSVIPVHSIEEAKTGRDLTYLVAFVGIGLFFSVLSYALTPTEWWPEGAAAALASEVASAGSLS
jgi:hypothetical protein